MPSPLADLNPLQRFSDRVDDYVRYRPGYPVELIARLKAHAGLAEASAVADVGSGTGIFTGLLLEAGAKVFAVEPNDAMRAAAERQFRGQPRFISQKGTAEATGLADHSVSLVTCAQAFHWFDPAGTRREWMRILVSGGRCALIWNVAIVEDSEFARGYERIKEQFGIDYHRIRHENVGTPDQFDPFFGPGAWTQASFANFQTLDLRGLIGRMLSSSYAPGAGHPGHEPMLAALRALFHRTQQDGVVRMEYTTNLFLGRLP